MKVLIVIVGPTAVGKTQIAISLGKRIGAEIISADSRQFYSGMEIGTAAPTDPEKKNVKHHFVAFRNPGDHLSAASYAKLADDFIGDYFRSKERLIMVGGSGLFIDAVLNGFHDLPPENKEIREDLESILNNQGLDVLTEELRKKDPIHYEKIDRKNPRRVIRALEVIRQTGVSFSELTSAKRRKKKGYKVVKLGLRMDRDILNQRISQRVDKMFEQGLVNEVRTLLPLKEAKALNSVGYVEIFEALAGNISFDEAREQIKSNTRNFAKKQMTWFRKDKEIEWFHPEERDMIVAYLEKNNGIGGA